MHKINLNFLKNYNLAWTFELKTYGLYLWLLFLCGLWYNPLIDGVCVRELKLVRYHNKEAKGKK